MTHFVTGLKDHLTADMTAADWEVIAQRAKEAADSAAGQANAAEKIAMAIRKISEMTGADVRLGFPGAVNDRAQTPGDAPDAELIDALHPAPVPPVEVQDMPQGPQSEPETGKSAFPAMAEPSDQDSPSAASTEPLRAMPEPPRTMNWAGLTLPERRIVKHLERLPDTFAPQDDLCLVEMLTSGNKIDLVAEFLGVARGDALDRWKSMLTDDVVGADGRPSLDGQKRLLAALRYRVEAA